MVDCMECTNFIKCHYSGQLTGRLTSCPDFKQKTKTNADCIRAMSDEELAELLGAIIREREIILLQKLREQGVEASIVEMPELTFNAHLEWLKQPAEE